MFIKLTSTYTINGGVPASETVYINSNQIVSIKKYTKSSNEFEVAEAKTKISTSSRHFNVKETLKEIDVLLQGVGVGLFN